MKADETPAKTETVTLAEVLGLTGLSRTAIYNRIRKGELTPLPKPPAFKKRAETVFNRADIEALLAPEDK